MEGFWIQIRITLKVTRSQKADWSHNTEGVGSIPGHLGKISQEELSLRIVYFLALDLYKSVGSHSVTKFISECRKHQLTLKRRTTGAYKTKVPQRRIQLTYCILFSVVFTSTPLATTSVLGSYWSSSSLN